MGHGMAWHSPAAFCFCIIFTQPLATLGHTWPHLVTFGHTGHAESKLRITTIHHKSNSGQLAQRTNIKQFTQQTNKGNAIHLQISNINIKCVVISSWCFSVNYLFFPSPLFHHLANLVPVVGERKAIHFLVVWWWWWWWWMIMMTMMMMTLTSWWFDDYDNCLNWSRKCVFLRKSLWDLINTNLANYKAKTKQNLGFCHFSFFWSDSSFLVSCTFIQATLTQNSGFDQIGKQEIL